MNEIYKKLNLQIINKNVINTFHPVKIKLNKNTDTLDLPLNYDKNNIKISVNGIDETYHIKEIKDNKLIMDHELKEGSEILLTTMCTFS